MSVQYSTPFTRFHDDGQLPLDCIWPCGFGLGPYSNGRYLRLGIYGWTCNEPRSSHHGLRHSFPRTLRRSGYSLQQIGKLLRHESGSSMTVMYADMSDDEIIETAQAVTLDQIEKVLKK